MKKAISLLLIAAMLTALTACNSTTGGTSGGSSEPSSSPASTVEESGETVSDPDNPWASFDTSEAVNLAVYVIGTEPNDMETVLEQINARMTTLINTTIDVNFISLADFSTKYPLVLTGGDEVDLVYTSSWTQFNQNAAKGAFVELTDEFLSTWMPETYKNEAQAAWEQVKIDGKIYAVPRNQTEMQNCGGVLIRTDLAEKYGFDLAEMDTLEEYEAFLYAVADGESEIYGFYNFPSNMLMQGTIYTALNNIFTVYDNLAVDANQSFDQPEDLQYLYLMEDYRDYILRMAEWAERGVWPSNAISGTTHTNDLFEEGKSASMVARVPEADNYITYMEEKGIEVEYVDILPKENYTRLTAYSGDCMAIASFSETPERAALALDVMKNDYDTNMLLLGGIEGTHHILNDDGTRSPGEKAADYGWDGYTWALRNDWNPQLKKHDIVSELEDQLYAQLMPDDVWVWDGFTGNEEEHSAQKAVIDSLISQYQYSFDLGVFGSETETQYDSFVDQLKQAGIDEVVAAWQQQAADFLASKG